MLRIVQNLNSIKYTSLLVSLKLRNSNKYYSVLILFCTKRKKNTYICFIKDGNKITIKLTATKIKDIKFSNLWMNFYLPLYNKYFH